MHRDPEPEPIVVAVDGSPHSDAAVEWAARESVLRNATVALVHAITPMPDTLADAAARSNVDRWYKDNANTVVAAAEAIFRAAHGQSRVVDVQTTVLEAPVLPALIDMSARAQLIVVGTRGQGAIGRLLMGSVSTGLVHHAQCPVAVIPLGETRHALNRDPVLLGVDGMAASEGAIAVAFDEAARRSAGLMALHAWSDVGVLPILGRWYDYETEATELLAKRLAGWQEKYPDVRVTRRVVCDVPAHALFVEARYSQLVVVGSRGRGGFAGLQLGSVASAIVHASPAPVIVVRGG
jgi:nucleotide-binding universal stress UspA family protein